MEPTATGAAANAITEVGKCSATWIARHVGYVYYFKKNIKDLGIAKGELEAKYATVKAAVERGMSNIEVVNEDVKAWLGKVEEFTKDVETLENKVCCNGWCPDWIWRYKQSKAATQKTAIVNEAFQDAGRLLPLFTYPAPIPGLEIFPSSDIEVFDSRKLAFNQIMEALDDDNSSRIGVWGMGGVGKTTLVKEVYKKAKTLGLFDDIVMAVVSQTPDIRKIQNEIAGHLKDFKLEENDYSERARRICSRIKKAEKILIILDDIWNDVNFEDIGIPNDHKGCKILITTRNDRVCNLMFCEKKVQLEVMTGEESLALFKKSAHIDDDVPISINDDVMRDVVRECQGLPIAIVVVGKTLIQRSLDEWYTALHKLRRSEFIKIDGVDEDKNAYVCLKLSYDYLKPINKLCFLLCSLFPEDHNIYIEDLIIYVIGLEEEYEQVKSNTEEVRRQVYAAINSLKHSSLLLDSFNKYSVKMHDVVRDVALWIASKGDNEFSMRACTSLKGISRFESVTAISLWANNTEHLLDKLVCPKLNFLSLGEMPKYELKNHERAEISDTMFEGMKGLKVLILRNKFLSSQSLQFLTNLRSLYLLNCNFDDFSSLGKLKSLESLTFDWCQMVALPNELGGLNSLKVLQLLGCRQLERIPSNLIQGLSQLEELRVNFGRFKNWEVERTSIERRNASLSELMSLSNLAMLYLEFPEKSLPTGFVFSKLQRYAIYVGFNDEKGYNLEGYERFLIFSYVNASSSFNVFNVLFCTVEGLELNDCQVQCFDDTMGGINDATLSNLVKLKLKNCRSLTNLFSLPLVQNLRKLDTLILKGCSELKQIISEEEFLFKRHHIQCFPKLRILRVINCEKLEYLFSISVARGFLLQLEELTIEDLPQLKQVFGNEREEEVGLDGNEFELSKLIKLSLQELPKLSNIFQGKNSSTWPSLEKLSVMSCPIMTPLFVADLVASLHTVRKRYVISIGSNFRRDDDSKSRFLRVVDVDASTLDAFKVFFSTVEVLELEKCEVECFIDTVTFSNLVKLILKDMPSLRTTWERPIQQTTFRNLSVLEARSCNRLINLFSPSLVQNLKNLETLILENCHELKQIISEEEMLFKCHHIQPPCFPKLRVLKVIDCRKLEYLFSISVARGFLLQLEELTIEDLPELKQVFGNEKEGEVGLDGNKFELFQLTELSLHNLPKLNNFCQGNISSTWPSLKRLSVISCQKLTPSFGVDLAAVGKKLQVFNVSNCSQLCNTVLDLLTQGLLDLEELKIESCEGLEDLFERERLLPSRLKILRLKDLLVQRCVWKGPTLLVNLNNLKKFEVCRCNRLRQLFSPATLAQSLQQLEYLTIKECDELENLIAEDEEDQVLSETEGHLKPLYFPKLNYVFVKECNKMKSLFPITIAYSLQQLFRIEVEGASQLAEVFVHKDEGDVEIRKDIKLPRLYFLTLNRLPSLISFCPRNYYFILPKLAYLKVQSCPNMSTSFARTPICTVHVNGEVPQLDQNDEAAVFSTTHQVIATRPTNKDIDWDHYTNLEALPMLY